MNNVNNIPEKYISSRWTKDAKKRLCHSVDSFKLNEKSTHVLCMNILSLLWYKCCDMAALTDNGTKIAMNSLSELLCKLEKSSAYTNRVEDVGKKCPQDLIHDERPILDLLHVRKKGITNFRIKSQLEKNQKKKKKSVKDATTSRAPKAISMEHGKYKTSTQAFFLTVCSYFLSFLFFSFSFSFLSDDAEKITSKPYSSNTLDTRPAQHRKRPYREYRCGTGQRPSEG